MTDIQRIGGGGRQGQHRRRLVKLVAVAAIAIGVLSLVAAGGFAISEALTEDEDIIDTTGDDQNETASDSTTIEPTVGVEVSQTNTTEGNDVSVYLYRVENVDHVTVSVDGTSQSKQVEGVGTVRFEGVDPGTQITVEYTVSGDTVELTTYTVPTE